MAVDTGPDSTGMDSPRVDSTSPGRTSPGRTSPDSTNIEATDPIHVACQSDGRLLPDCAVMIRSLVVTNPAERFTIHFLHGEDDDPAVRDQLGAITTDLGAVWAPAPIATAKLQGLPFAPAYGGFAACYRLLLPELLPEVDRILYLDADVLVRRPIRPLWETDLEDGAVAAVTNPLYRHMEPRIQRDLGLPDRLAYFNSGVLVLDLDRLRRTGLDGELVAFARANAGRVAWPDQDVLNAVLWRHRLRLPPRWNAMPALWELRPESLPWSAGEVAEGRQSPAIAHFLGPYKAQHYRCTHPARSEFAGHLDRTPFAGRGATGRTVKNMVLRPLPPLLRWTVEAGPLELRTEAAYRAKRSTAGSLARDAYRWATPSTRRDPVRTVLEALSNTVHPVRFVQVGSNDGEHDDPLRPLILADGWTGVMVEPVPYVFERLRRNYRGRPGIQLVNAAIGDHDGDAEFFAVTESDGPLPQWYDQLGSWSLEHIMKHSEYIPGLADRIVTLTVPSLTFESLCRRHGIGAIDVIHIDAEGYDHEIIKGIDLVGHRPTLVMYEYKHLPPDDLTACRRLLGDAGYELLDVGWDTLAARRDAVAAPWTRLGRAWRLARHQSQDQRPVTD